MTMRQPLTGKSPPQFAQKGLTWSKRRRPWSTRLETSKQEFGEVRREWLLNGGCQNLIHISGSSLCLHTRGRGRSWKL